MLLAAEPVQMSRKISETKRPFASNTHTTVNDHTMKTKLENQQSPDDNSHAKPAVTPSKGRTLKAAAIALAVLALGLSYRAATEAVTVYAMLEKVQDTLAQEQVIRAAAPHVYQNSETITPVAGL